MRVKDAVGRFGEQVAADYLTAAGWSILQRNWRCPQGEIDIIARAGTVLAIVEVKTRSSIAFGDPAEAVTPAKAARVRRLAAAWLAERRAAGELDGSPELRFDVVSVVRDTRAAVGVAVVRHLPAAF